MNDVIKLSEYRDWLRDLKQQIYAQISEQVVPIFEKTVNEVNTISEQVVRENEFVAQIVRKLASIPWGKNIFIFQKIPVNKTSFLPNSINKTTSVETRKPSLATSRVLRKVQALPHYSTFNEVIRLVSQVVNFSTEVVLLKNEVKIRFRYPQKRTKVLEYQ